MTNEGMVEGLTYITSLVDEGLAAENVDWEAAHVQFETGASAFIMTGPWAINRFQEAGVPYAIAPFPAAEEGGEAGYPFLGVQGLIVNANSEQLLLAQAFATEKIATEDSMQRIFEAEPRPSAWASVFELADDADTLAFNEAGVGRGPDAGDPGDGLRVGPMGQRRHVGDQRRTGTRRCPRAGRGTDRVADRRRGLINRLHRTQARWRL